MKFRKTKWSRRIRHIFVVFVFLLLLVSLGTVIVNISNHVVAVAVARQDISSAASGAISFVSSQAVSKPPASSGPASSAASSIASSPPVNKPVSSAAPVSRPSSQSPKPPVSSVPPMDPAVYQAMYPNLYAPKSDPPVPVKGKVVYLTFDDGPSNLTIPLLDVLDHYKVKATFFLVGKTDAQDLKAMKAIVDRGHAIGVHSYTHILPQIYKTPAVFLDDFAKMHDLILKTTGVDTPIYRFAGGSINDYNKATANAIITEMNRRGYTYFDWNVSSGDAEYGSTDASIYNDTIRQVHAHAQSVALFHNTAVKGSTLKEIPKIIETLQKEGYRFETLSPSVDNRPYIFRVPKK